MKPEDQVPPPGPSLAFESGHIYTWAKVSTVHKARIGIYQRNGQLISLLTDFGRINPCYPDVRDNASGRIIYTGNGRRGNQKLDAQNRSLLDAIEKEISVPLFNKLSPGRWEFLGFWRVVDGEYVYDKKQDRMVWKFTLNLEN